MNKKRLINNYIVIGLMVFISILYVFLRIYHIREVPYFLDELIYARWAQQGFYNANDRLVSLSDGKQPLYIWLVSLLMIKIRNPVAAGRLVSIVSGVGTIIGLFWISILLFKSKKIALVASALYILWPFSLILNRLSLYETFLGMLFLFVFIGEWYLLYNPNFQNAFLLGILFGGVLLTKTTGVFAIIFFPLLLIFFRKKIRLLLHISFFFIVAILIAVSYLSVFLLSSNAFYIIKKSGDFLYSLPELRHLSFTKIIFHNLTSLMNWEMSYMTFPLFMLCIVGLFLPVRYKKEIIVLFLWFVIPFLFYVFFGKILYPRYLYVHSLYLIPIISYLIINIYFKITNKTLAIGSIILLIFPMMYRSYRILAAIDNALIPDIDKYQYVIGWPSGYGVDSIIRFLQNLSENEKIIVATEGIYGSLPTTFIDIFFMHSPTVEHISIPYEKVSTISSELQKKACYKRTFLIVNKLQDKLSYPSVLILERKKGTKGEYIRLYSIIKDQKICQYL